MKKNALSDDSLFSDFGNVGPNAALDESPATVPAAFTTFEYIHWIFGQSSPEFLLSLYRTAFEDLALPIPSEFAPKHLASFLEAFEAQHMIEAGLKLPPPSSVIRARLEAAQFIFDQARGGAGGAR